MSKFDYEDMATDTSVCGFIAWEQSVFKREWLERAANDKVPGGWIAARIDGTLRAVSGASLDDVCKRARAMDASK